MYENALSEEVVNDLIKIGEKKKIKSLYSLINFKEKVDKLYLVLKGGIILLHVHPETRVERAINFFIPSFHPIASIAESFYFNTPSDYHLKTFTNTIAIEITKKDFNNYLHASQNARLVQEYGIKTLLEKNTLRANLVSLNSLEMLKYLHKNYPQILQQIPSKYVANFLGITPQWLSKLKRSL